MLPMQQWLCADSVSVKSRAVTDLAFVSVRS